jgi:hypothetical protein
MLKLTSRNAGVDWIYLAQIRNKCHAVVNVVTSLWFPWMATHFLTSWAIVSSYVRTPPLTRRKNEGGWEQDTEYYYLDPKWWTSGERVIGYEMKGKSLHRLLCRPPMITPLHFPCVSGLQRMCDFQHSVVCRLSGGETCLVLFKQNCNIK